MRITRLVRSVKLIQIIKSHLRRSLSLNAVNGLIQFHFLPQAIAFAIQVSLIMLKFLAHDCTLHFVPITAEDVKSQNKPKGTKVTYIGSPILTGCFTNENAYVGSGYDKTPILF